MGASKSKVRKLNPRTITDLQKHIDVDFSRDEIEQWFREYQSSLNKGMSKLTVKEFTKVYDSVFDGDAAEFVQHLFRSFDADHDGFVDFKEFIVGLCVSGSDNVDTKLRWAFNMYDIDGNGSITREEMAGMLKAIYKMVSTDDINTIDDMNALDTLISEFFESADRNNDNVITKDEFVQGVKSMPVILHLLQCDPDPVENFDSLDIQDDKTKAKPKTQGAKSERMASYEAK